MASNTTSQADENPYFSRRNPDLTNTASAPQPYTPTNAQGPTTPAREQPPVLSRPAGTANRQQSSIGLRYLRARPSRTRIDSNTNLNSKSHPNPVDNDRQRANAQRHDEGEDAGEAANRRRRSTSEPHRPTWLDDPASGAETPQHLAPVSETADSVKSKRSFLAPGRRPSWLPRFPTRQQRPPQEFQQTDQRTAAEIANQREYDSRIVDLLDVVDPEVSTLTSMTNLQNSLFIPSLGRFVNRRPTYDISWAPPRGPGNQQQENLEDIPEQSQPRPDGGDQRPSTGRAHSITSNVESTHYAVLPHGESLEGWSREDIDRLNDHVRHMMHSRRSKFKRSMKGFGSYVSRPLGFLVTLYGTLITLFGLAWVLFLIGWIEVGEKQLYVINIIDYTLVALFAIVGDGLAPFRAVDTYHMIYIAHYHRLSWKLRQKLLLPDLRDHNDLPTENVLPDLEAAHSIPSLAPGEEISVLTPQQQEKLTHHQAKYSKSHTFYRPHETETHFAFPLKLLVTITLLLDLHSCLQISLGSCTWGIPYAQRPAALTTTILCCSITANATAGLVIWIGDRRTRKKDVIERMSRQELTEEAMRKVKRDNEKEAARKEEEEREAARKLEYEEEGRKSLSLPSMPRLSLDKVAGSFGKKGESSSQREKDVLREES